MKLDIEEIVFDPVSIVDPNGRVFHWNDGIYRGVSAQAADLYSGLLKQGDCIPLFERGLVNTEIAPLELDGYELVLKHDKIPFVSYGFEWCGAMYKAAALLVIDLSIDLEKLGFELQDAHPMNILFDRNRPVLIDFGSIAPIGQKPHWRPIIEFITRFLNPLYLMSKGYAPYVRTLQFDADGDYEVLQALTREVASILRWEHKIEYLIGPVTRQTKTWRSYDRQKALDCLREIVENIDVDLPESRKNSHHKHSLGLEETDHQPQYQQTITTIIQDCNPKTVLDVKYDSYAWKINITQEPNRTVVALNNDETIIQDLFYQAKQNQDDVFPLLMDVGKPTPAFGVRLQYPSAFQRLKCDLVLALSVIHYLVFEQKLHFAEIAPILAAFSERFLLVEFIPQEDPCISNLYDTHFEWYQYSQFVKELQLYFKSVEIISLDFSDRKLLFCQKH